MALLWTTLHRVEIVPGNDPLRSKNIKSKSMNEETQTSFHHLRPPRPGRTVANALVTTILRSRWHKMRSDHLLLLTFTGRKSGKEYTTPLRYTQEGETLRVEIIYPWWKNLVGGATVHVLLRGEVRTGTTEVCPNEGKVGGVAVKIHLRIVNSF
jgi:hypothetical protein